MCKQNEDCTTRRVQLNALIDLSNRKRERGRDKREREGERGGKS